MKYILLVFVTLLQACVQSKPNTPVPSDEFTAVAHYSSQLGSAEIAREEAERFCKHWRAKPGIIKSETVDLRIVNQETPETAVKETATRLLSTGKLFKDEQPFRTTIIYKCY